MYFCILNFGEVAEWSIAAVSKTVVRRKTDRGFESPLLRQNIKIRRQPVFLFSGTLKLV